MLYQKIVLAGGNGYLGAVLARYYSARAEKVVILARKHSAAVENILTVLWDGKEPGDWQAELEGADLLINLCGRTVNCRYTAENRREIFQSRIATTRLLAKAIEACIAPPRVWINISSATIYRHAEDRPQDEYTGDIGYGFSVDICKAWEAAFFETAMPCTRRVALRMGIVLGRNDGAFPRLLNLVKAGLGGKHGHGGQYVSWIHEQDVARCTDWIVQHAAVNGVINCTAPEAIKNADLMNTIRNTYGMPCGLPAPQWLLNIGMRVMGTETELVLKSRWVAPARLIAEGFRFQFTSASHAIHDLLSVRILK